MRGRAPNLKRGVPSPCARALVALTWAACAATSASAGLIGEVPLPEGRIDRAAASASGSRVLLLIAPWESRPAGLHIVDSTDFRRPRLTGFFPLPLNARFALSEDGRRALILNAPEREQYNQALPHEIIAIDLSDPRSPKEVLRRTVVARGAVIAPDASAYAISAPAAQSGQWQLEVGWPGETRFSITIPEGDWSRSGAALSARGAFLVLNSFNRNLQAYDLRGSQPTMRTQDHFGVDRYGCIAAILDSGHAVVEDTRTPRLGVYAFTERLPRIAALPHASGQHCADSRIGGGAGEYVFAVDERTLRWVDLRDPAKPAMGPQLRLPRHLAALAASREQLYVAYHGGKGPMLQVFSRDTSFDNSVDWPRLVDAHREAMRTYNEELKGRKPVPYWNAIRRLEQADVQDAIDSSVPPPEPRKAAEILNDYGFLLGKGLDQSDRAEAALRRALSLDPKRAIAHLNLADLIKSQLPTISEWKKKDERAQEAARHYRRYLALGGRRSPALDAFLASGKQAKPSGKFCETIAGYANASRLGDLISSAGIGVLAQGRRIDIVFTTEGTAHVPATHAYDSESDIPVDLGTIVPGIDFGDLWGGDELGLVVHGDDAHILHYRDAHHPVKSFSLRGGDTCSFSTSTEEAIGPDAADPETCKALASGAGQDAFLFEGQAWMTREDVGQRYGETDIAGTELVDVANDGKPVNVGKFGLSSGAGAGCDAIFFDLLDRNGTRFEDGPKRDMLMTMQKADPTNRYPVLPCGNQPSFFKFKGKVYFESRPKVWPPVDQWHQYHHLTRVDNGQVVNVCDYRFRTMVSVD
jgi:hypothetical protein